MTIDQIKQSDKAFLTAEDVAGATHQNAHYIRVQAHKDPKALGYPVSVTGTRVRIPREGFLHWYRFGAAR